MSDEARDQAVSFESPDVEAALKDLEILVEGVDEIPPTETQPDDPEFKGKSRDELIAQVRSQRAEIQAAKERSIEQIALKEAINELKESRARPAVMPQQQQPTETEEQFRERVNKSFYDDPYGTLTEFQVRKLAPEVTRIMSSNMRLSRKLVALDPQRLETFQQYSAEIDDYVAQLSPQAKLYDADVYEKAHDAVVARHVNEIVERKVAEAIKPKAPAAPAPPHTETLKTTAPLSASKTRIVLTPKEMRYIADHGLTKESYAEYVLRHPDRRIK
jgi:hypothetical protein